MARGAYACFRSRRLRGESSIIALTMKRSHEAIREWVQRFFPPPDRFASHGSEVGSILIDGAMMESEGTVQGPILP